MEEVKISDSQLNDYKKGMVDLNLATKRIAELEAKNTELSENFKGSKAEAKIKSDKKLLEVTNEKEAIEKDLKTFRETLNIGEDVEDLKSHLVNLNSDISKYGEIKEREEIKTKEEIKTYTDFLNEKDGEYLKDKVNIFGEEILENVEQLKYFANNQGYKESETDNNKNIKVGEITSTKEAGRQDSFNSAYKSGDINAMNSSIANNI